MTIPMHAYEFRFKNIIRNNCLYIYVYAFMNKYDTSLSCILCKQEAEHTAFVAQLTHEITMAQNTQENLRKQIKDRDDRISALEATVASLDTKSQALEQDLTRISTQELGLLQNSLREIGKLLLSDFDQHGIEEGHELHLTSLPAIFVYDDSGESPTVFAESIVSAVQAALNKRQLQIHSLQVCSLESIFKKIFKCFIILYNFKRDFN